MELLALCGVCLLERRKVNNPPHKASALTYDSVCQDCGKQADYFVARWIENAWTMRKDGRHAENMQA